MEFKVHINGQCIFRTRFVNLYGVVDDKVYRYFRIDLSGSPPTEAIAFLNEARSTTAGTPVKSCK
ncbi:hypothetical protein PO124_13610 [Bacillus licheniformis]|nr:hypothetical protein [Bacillus licheniformis]